QDGGAIRFLVFDALDHKRERAGGVVVAIAPGQRWPRVGAAIVREVFAIRLRCWLPGQGLACAPEINAVKELHERDDVAACAAAAAVEYLLLDVDGEAVLAAALGAGATTLFSAGEFDAAPVGLVLDSYAAGLFAPGIPRR